jgi:hypothetical protein
MWIQPKTFAEFYAQYPDYVRNVARNLLRYRGAEADVDDLTHDLLLHLMAPLSNGKDRIGAIPPVIDAPSDKHRQNILFYFIKKMCLQKYLTLKDKRGRSNPDIGAYHIIEENDFKDGRAKALPSALVYDPNTDLYVYLGEIRAHIAKRAPMLLPVFDGMAEGYDASEIAERLGVPAYSVYHMTNRLRKQGSKLMAPEHRAKLISLRAKERVAKKKADGYVSPLKGRTRHHASAETRRKMSLAHMGNRSNLGRKLSEEHKAKLRAIAGTPEARQRAREIRAKQVFTKESIAKRRDKLTGHSVSEETKQKIRTKALERWSRWKAAAA